jgi:type VI secretion system VasD/TssJ family lipoprotein
MILIFMKNSRTEPFTTLVERSPVNDRRPDRHSSGGVFPRATRAASLLALLLAVLLPAACGGNGKNKPDPSKVPATKPAPAESPDKVHWTYEPDAIELIIYADENMNTYNGYAHTTMLCIYQMKKPGAFKQLASSEAGVRKLLECSGFDPSVAHFEKIFVQPNQNSTRSMARAEKAKHVGLVAGYYDLKPEGVTRMYDIPLHKEETGMLWWSKDNYTPGKLSMKLLLGPHSIQRVGEH